MNKRQKELVKITEDGLINSWYDNELTTVQVIRLAIERGIRLGRKFEREKMSEINFPDWDKHRPI